MDFQNKSKRYQKYQKGRFLASSPKEEARTKLHEIQRLQHEEKEVRHIVEAGKRGGEEIEDIVLD
ncbi:hypothetical protein JHK87_033761 [Glycine soja]|nr:hypothetical protein JHK87_033761 [Glycine soja]